MYTKELLLTEIDNLIKLLRICANSRLILLIILSPTIIDKITGFHNDCLCLKRKIAQIDENSDEFMELIKEFFDLEMRVQKRIAILQTFPNVMGAYIGIFAAYTLIFHLNIIGIVSSILGIVTPEKLITFGISGAFIYLATSHLAEQYDDPKAKYLIDFPIRLFLAVVVPIILVALFFKADGSAANMAVTPELLSFICGYSSKLVVDIFNKLIEKASKMIESI